MDGLIKSGFRITGHSNGTSNHDIQPIEELDAEQLTLIEGLPGHGLVAAIATDMITKQLNLEHYGNIVSEDFPPVTSFEDGRVRDLVRVYAGADPPIMTLQSDIALPSPSFKALAGCILEDISAEFKQAIFLAGSPAETEEQIGDVIGVATSDSVETMLRSANIEMAEGLGLIGGITGALVSECYHARLPVAVLIVKANPFLPDPWAARAVIENALEPLVDFDIDTSELEQQADMIKTKMEQLARHYREITEASQPPREEPVVPNMYQ